MIPADDAATVVSQLRHELAGLVGLDSLDPDTVLAFADGHLARALDRLSGRAPQPVLIAGRL